ncbi:MAG TPA: ECF-type sigma factor [Vicinamibacterales bacterium]|nr:ECF-type sigma factor [Vicinamibacterales bacterium]
MWSSPITASATDGQPDAQALFGALYSELHRLAKRQLARGGSDAGLGVTTLLHEAYLDISSRHGAVFPDEARFMGYAARVMRGLIIDHARAEHASKRGGDVELTSLRTDVIDAHADPRELTAIGDALDELATIDPPLAEIVDLKFFCGLSFAEIGAMRGQSERTVQRKWEKARIYLHARIRGQADPP